MQPYQEASEESSRQSYRPFQAASTLAGSALKVGIGGRIMSFLNKYIPPDLAAKGLSKIDPRLGKFINLGQEAGYSFDDIADYTKQKIAGQEEPAAQQHKNIIEQESPELHQFLDQQIRAGRNPIEAAAIAQGDKRFINAIKKLEKAHKTPWSQIIQGIFGTGERALSNSGNPSQISRQPETMGQEKDSGFNPKIEAALDKIMSL
jgi:hypothetical protein